MEILNLITSRLNIRNLEFKDLSDFHIYRSNPDVTKYQGFDIMTVEQAGELSKDNLRKNLAKQVNGCNMVLKILRQEN